MGKRHKNILSILLGANSHELQTRKIMVKWNFCILYSKKWVREKEGQKQSRACWFSKGNYSVWWLTAKPCDHSASFYQTGSYTPPFTVNHSTRWRGFHLKKWKQHWPENIGGTSGIMAREAKDGEREIKHVKEPDSKSLFFSNTKVCLWESGKYILSTRLKIRTLFWNM